MAQKPFSEFCCTRLYNPLCPSVGRSHFTFFMILFIWPHCSCPNGLVTSNMAPAQPHATSVTVYPALFLSWLLKKRKQLVKRFIHASIPLFLFFVSWWKKKLVRSINSSFTAQLLSVVFFFHGLFNSLALFKCHTDFLLGHRQSITHDALTLSSCAANYDTALPISLSDYECSESQTTQVFGASQRSVGLNASKNAFMHHHTRLNHAIRPREAAERFWYIV